MRAATDTGRGAHVQMHAITKRYGVHRAVDAVDLDIRPGEFITFLGPSGSGKTTMLMLIAGFAAPTSGEITIDGCPVARLPPYRRNIGMVFQSYALFPHMTVAENIAFPLKQRGVARSDRQAAVAKMLDLVQLDGFGARFPQQLSGGQQQRVAIARAIVFNPRVLLMDEPLSALDKQLRETLLEIKRLHDRLGITFVYVTHDQREALVMSDRVSVINAGRIEQIATPQALYNEPANRFVAAFVGEANFAAVEHVTPCADGTMSLRTAWGDEIWVPRQEAPPGCACMVRPEKMSALPRGAEPQDGMNAISAQVREVVFMGEAVRYALETASGCTVLVKQQNRAGTPILAPNAAAVVTWAVQDTRLVS